MKLSKRHWAVLWLSLIAIEMALTLAYRLYGREGLGLVGAGFFIGFPFWPVIDRLLTVSDKTSECVSAAKR